MSSSYTKLLYHLVFGTKNREPVLSGEFRQHLYEYMGGIIRGEGGTLLEIGGGADHIHLLIAWRADQPLSVLLKDLKRNSSLWANKTFPNQKPFHWQDGYGAFSVSPSMTDKVRDYIQNQEQHHQKQDFRKEFVALLKAHGIPFDPRWMDKEWEKENP